MKRKTILLLIVIFSVNLSIGITSFSFAKTDAIFKEPDTFIVNPPQSDLGYNNLRIWWIGRTEDLGTKIKGFYYQLDGGRYEFTEKNYLTLYELSGRPHTIRVKAIDENLVEDSSPVVYSFNVQDEAETIGQEVEPNDNEVSAFSIENNRMIKGTTESFGDIDWYKFEVDSQLDFVNILVKRSIGFSSTRIKVYNGFVSSGTLLSEFTIDSSNKERNCITLGVNQGERYFVKIEPQSFDPDIKDYYLTVQANKSNHNVFWDTEPNNSPEYATELMLSQENVKNFGFANMNSLVDWYKIHIDSPQLLSMSISQSSAALTPSNISLYSSPLAEDKDLIGRISTGVFQTAVTLGDYFVKVENNRFDSETPYLLEFQLLDLPYNQIVEFEPNNTSPLEDPTSASKLALDTPLIGNSWNGNIDIDWFEIQVPKVTIEATDLFESVEPMLCLTLSRKQGIGTTSIQLYNPNFTELEQKEINTSNNQYITLSSKVSTDGGKYYIKLDPQNESTRTDYKLTAFYFSSAQQSTEEPLALDETLYLQLIWEPGNEVYFDLVGNFREPDASRYNSIKMYDDGQHSDGQAGDGIYIGQFTPSFGDDVMSAKVLIHVLEQVSGLQENQVDFYLPGTVSIDTIAPELYSLEHSAGAEALVTGETLVVKLYGERNAKAEFDIGSFLQGIEMQYVGGIDTDVPPPLPPYPMRQLTSQSDSNDEDDGNYYIGTYTVKPDDCVVNAKITARLIDKAGNITRSTHKQPVTIAGDGPKIYSAEHSAVDTPLKLNDILFVTVRTEPNANVKFKVDELDSILMYDDGMHNDEQANDGIYAGNYKVSSKDELEEVPVTISVNKLGLSAQVELADKVTLDGVSPEPVTQVSAIDVADDQGYNLEVSWGINQSWHDVIYFNLYTSKAPINSVVNRKPVQTVVSDVTSYVAHVEENDIPYYVAVTAVDRASNESKLGLTSSYGPVKALDNLIPPPVEIISAFDTPHDFGKQISLEWYALSNVEDLDYYNIYVYDKPYSSEGNNEVIEQLKSITASYDVMVSADEADYYFAVTAVDLSGNESEIADYSFVGPIQSTTELEEEQDLQIITAPSGLIRKDDAVFRWLGGEKIVYQMDNSAQQSTELSEVSFTNLSDGEHIFKLKSGEIQLSRPFIVNKTVISETEPNNTQDTANRLPLGFTIAGELNDDDLFNFTLSNPGLVDIFIDRENINLELTDNSSVVVETLQSKKVSVGLESGDYYLKLTGNADYYELSATYYPTYTDVNFEVEPNENANSATHIALSNMTIGSISQNEQDWFHINLKEPGILASYVSAQEQSSQDNGEPLLKLKLWNSAATLIKEASSSLSYFLPSGEYFISVQNNLPNEFVSIPYRLTNVLIKSLRMQIKDKPQSAITFQNSEADFSTLTLGDTLVLEAVLQQQKNVNFSLDSIAKNILLNDEGQDGTYVGEYSIPDEIEKNDIPVQISVIDKYNNVTKFQPFYIDIDTKSSPIISITHNAEKTLRKNELLEVTIEAEPDADASFMLVNKSGKSVLENDDFEVKANPDGSYIGAYKVQSGDEFEGTLVGNLVRYNGRKVSKNADRIVKVDAVSPEKVSNLKAQDIPNDQGFIIKVNWDKSTASDFSHYQLYLGRGQIGDIGTITPKIDSLKTNSVQVDVDENDVVFYVAVVVVDKAGNKSDMAMVGPVSAVDNISPEPVGVLTAFDTPNDSGGSVTVRWTKPSTAEDFEYYKIYYCPHSQDFENNPVFWLEGSEFAEGKEQHCQIEFSNNKNLLNIEIQGLENNLDYYFAVTAVDKSGNESEIIEDSWFGPVSALDNSADIGISSIKWLIGPEGIIRYNTATFVWNRWTTDNPIKRYFYKLDNTGEKITTENFVTLHNIKDGSHTFSIRAEGDTSYAVKSFTVRKSGLQESEPNDTVPQPTELNMPHLGELASGDTDLYLIDKFQSKSPLIFVSVSDGFSYELKSPTTTLNYLPVFPLIGINPENQYLIEITNDNEESEGYELVIDDYRQPEGIFWDIEPNDIQELATPFYVADLETRGETVALLGNAKQIDDVDWFYFNNSGLKNCLLKGYGVKKINVFSVSKESTEQIAEFTPVTQQSNFKEEFGLTDSTYFFQVHADNNYSINLNLGDTEPGRYEFEPNNNQLTATPMKLMRTVKGTIWNNADEDWYKIELGEDGTVVLTVDELRAANYELKVINSKGEEELLTQIVDSSNSARYFQTDVQAGNYFVKIKPESEAITQASYELLAILVNSAEISVERTGNRPPYVLAEDDFLKIRLTTKAGETGSFDIGGLQQDIPMEVMESYPMIYAGEYQVKSGDNVTEARITVNLQNVDSKIVKVAISPLINIDTRAPVISSITHDAKKPLGAGNELHLTLHGEPDSKASFVISGDGFETVPAEMQETETGVYTGAYVVADNDNVQDAKVIATLTDIAGNETQKTADSFVTLDTIPPEIKKIQIEPTTQVLTDEDELTVKLTGEAFCLAYFRIGEIASNIRMYDDGKHDDGEADDGVYVGNYIVKPGDISYDSVVICRLTDQAENQSERSSTEAVTIDTMVPNIESVEHDAEKPICADDALNVTVIAETGTEGVWSIGEYRTNLPLYDDGTNGDETANDGIYNGKYIVRAGDNVQSATLSVTLTKKNGKSATKSSLKKVTIDTSAPQSVKNVNVSDIPDDSGFFLRLKWSAIDEPDFDNYNVYQANMPITQLDRDPVKLLSKQSLHLQSQDGIISAEVEVEKNDIDYYFAVTAIDKAGNESELILDDNGSVAGPIRAKDNLPPAAIRELQAYDRPDDYGKVISLIWKEPSAALDFGYYNVYLSTEQIEESDIKEGLLSPIVKIDERLVRSFDVSTTDGIDYYLAVTAIDVSGNESALSVVGPVQSVNNIGDTIETPIRIINGPIGLIRQRAATFRWSPWVETELSQFSFKLDSGNYQYTNFNKVTFYNLKNGQHKFFLKTLDGEITTRIFNVEPLFTSESEPNNSPNFANTISSNAIVHGNNSDEADEDWYVWSTNENMNCRLFDLHFVRPTGIGTTVIGIFRDGRKLSEFEVSSETHQRGTASIGVKSGEYQIKVRAEGENPGAEYELSISPNNSNITIENTEYVYEIEFNDQFEFATQLGDLSKPLELIGGTSQQNDIDWYEFSRSEISNQKSAFIHMIRPESLANTKIEIYYQNPNIESNKIAEFVLSFQNEQHISTAFATKAGAYFVKVENSENDSSNYIFRIESQTATKAHEIEPNNNSISANEINIGDKVYANLWQTTNDQDWYKISVPKNSILALALESPSVVGEVKAILYDSFRKELGSFNVRPETGYVGHFNTNVVSGNYYIEIISEQESEISIQQLEYSLTSALVNHAEYAARSSEPPNPIIDVMGVGDELAVSLEYDESVVADFTLGEMKDNFIRALPNFQPVPMKEQENGIYVGKYLVEPEINISDGFVLIEFKTSEQDHFTHRVVLQPPITIDTQPPKINEVRHNGNSQHPFSVEQELTVKVVSEPDCEGKFEVAGTTSLLLQEELYDDGQHDDGAPDDGIYGGKYTIVPGDNIENAQLSVWLEDKAGNRTEKFKARTPIFIDTLPPDIESLDFEIIRTEDIELETQRLELQENRLRTGDVLQVILKGEKDCTAEFDLGDIKQSLKLFDDGTHSDQEFGDGIYTNSYVVRKEDNVENALITVRLIDKAGNISELDSQRLISIDTNPPQIISITHDSQRPLVKNDTLTVTLEGDVNGIAFFEIENLVDNIPMADDGAGIDSQANDGVYTGVYKVKEGDDIKDATIIGYLFDKNMNKATDYASTKVTIDAVVPDSISGVKAFDVPGDEGNMLQVSWNASDIDDFGRYNIYRESSLIRTTIGLIPVKSSLVFGKDTNINQMQENTNAEVLVPANNIDYYIAVTVVDIAGNESPLGEVFGPIQAKDNILPPPARKVEAKDKPDDNGKVLSVSWQSLPLTENQLKGIERDDFKQYQVYVATQPFQEETIPDELQPADIDGLTNRDATSADVPVSEDEQDYYVAVIALDENGNKSNLDLQKDGSTAGPVRSYDQIAPSPVMEVYAFDTPSDLGGYISVSWIKSDSDDLSYYNVYLDTSEITDKSDLERLFPILITPESMYSNQSSEQDVIYIDLETPQDEKLYYLAVTAVDKGGNESELDDSSITGPVQSVSNRIIANQQTVIPAGLDPETKIIIPADASMSGQNVDIFVPFEGEILTKINEADHYLEQSHIDEAVDDRLKNTVFYFSPSNLEFKRTVQIIISYESANIQENWESELRIFRLNEDTEIARWELVQGVQNVDINHDIVSVEIYKLGVFRIARLKLPANLDNVVVYPNPFNPSLSSKVTFLNLEKGSSIDIYTINGEFIKSIAEMAEDRAAWDGKNQEGRNVAGGLYIYVVKSENDKAVGRILLIR